jgi:hypothetical protein
MFSARFSSLFKHQNEEKVFYIRKIWAEAFKVQSSNNIKPTIFVRVVEGEPVPFL